MNANAPDIDQNIDRALSALRDASPRSGLNRRILASLEHRTIAPQPARSLLPAHFALWCATSAAILAVASLAILHHQTISPTNPSAKPVILSGARRAESKDPEIASRATSAEPFSTTNLSRVTHTLSSRPERVARSGDGVPGQLAGRGAETRISDHHPDEVTDPDAQALADLHAPSHPAPPLPLTPQEKLFLRMLRYGNLTQLAELNPLVRAQQDADETAAFKAFFPDPPPLKQPLGDTE